MDALAAKPVQGGVAKGRQVVRRVAAEDSQAVFAQRFVPHVVQAVLDASLPVHNTEASTTERALSL